MNKQSTFIIQKQVFEISAASSASDFEWESYASAYLRDIITPAIEACFRNLTFEDKHLIIDKLEIDLGAFTRAGFEKEAAQRLTEQLNDCLRSCYSRYNADEHTGRPQHSREKDTGHYGKKETGKEKIQLLNKPEARMLALLHFLKQGRFPWWYTNNEHPVGLHDEWSTDLIKSLQEKVTLTNQLAALDHQFTESWIKSLNEKELTALKETLLTTEAARIRFVNHFSAAWIHQCLSILWLIHKNVWELWEITAPVMKSFSYAGPLFHQYFWISSIENAVRDEINIISLIEKTAGRQTSRAVELAQALYEECSQHKSNSTCKALASATGKYIAAKNSPAVTNKEVSDKRKASSKSNDAGTAENTNRNRQLVEQALKEIFQKKSVDGDLTGFGDDDALFVPAAGIVILHPFLAELFKTTGLWDDDNWCTPESPYRAIRLLSYLAFGEAGLPEYQLLFFKLLAGIDIETVLPAEAPLTNEEIAACNELLAAVIMHWKALRNTSEGGLQEGFLQRQGKITQSATGYQLTVERLAQDILLAQLPWGYSMIKLPWMEEMLNVTWI